MVPEWSTSRSSNSSKMSSTVSLSTLPSFISMTVKNSSRSTSPSPSLSISMNMLFVKRAVSVRCATSRCFTAARAPVITPTARASDSVDSTRKNTANPRDSRVCGSMSPNPTVDDVITTKYTASSRLKPSTTWKNAPPTKHTTAKIPNDAAIELFSSFVRCPSGVSSSTCVASAFNSISSFFSTIRSTKYDTIAKIIEMARITYSTVNIFDTVRVGVKSPYPTVVSTTVQKYSESITPHPSTK
mmetsp:Transcript_21140/g.51617  ORF Transcript_21140/g.51617 Transcript_21140/m.51617 type:complete len:243 (+) Transcript_21140:147-875(+)